MADPRNNATGLPDAIAQARAAVQTEWAAKVPGLSITVAREGLTLWTQQFGFADLAARTPITPSSRFRIASVSKPLTAAGLALLVERGLIDLDAPVQKYLPDFPRKDGTITPRLLAGHLTGIRNYRGTEATSRHAPVSLRAGLEVFQDDPLESKPGTRFSYSSYNWNLLGAIMEAATGQDFVDYLDASVIKPLGLSHTVPDRAEATDPLRTQFYETSAEGKFVQAPRVDYSYKWPSGGYLSSADDLVLLGNAHLRAGFLRPESLHWLFTSQKTTDGKPTHYGAGWFVGRDIVYHGGDNWGGTAILLIKPSARVVVAVVSNGSQILLRNAQRRGKLPPGADQFVFNKAAIAHQIATLFESAEAPAIK